MNINQNRADGGLRLAVPPGRRQVTTEQRVDRLEEVVATMGELLIETRAMVVEMRRENRQTRPIWIAIARTMELFDDDELQDLFGDEE